MLYAMFSGKYDVVYNAEDCVFIDRDGSHFHLILNWLRNKNVPPALTPGERYFLRQEAEYYGLRELVAHLETHASTSDSGDQVWDCIRPFVLRFLSLLSVCLPLHLFPLVFRHTMHA